MQFGLNWDGQVLRLEGIETHQLPSRRLTTCEKSAQLARDNALLGNLNLDGNQPMMTLHFALQPGADRGTSIEHSPCWLDLGAVNEPPWAWPVTITPKEGRCSAAKD